VTDGISGSDINNTANSPSPAKPDTSAFAAATVAPQGRHAEVALKKDQQSPVLDSRASASSSTSLSSMTTGLSRPEVPLVSGLIAFYSFAFPFFFLNDYIETYPKS
jgi:hypothetical protein